MKYEFKRGGNSYRGIQPKVAAKELERIRKEKGRLYTEDVVESARPVKAPLHSAFTWDDGEAAKQYRLWEARVLIRNVVVRQTDDADPEPVFVHVTLSNEQEEGGTEQYYQSSRVIVNSATELQAALDAARLRLSSAEKSLDDLKRIGASSPHIKIISTAAKHARKASEVLETVPV